MYKDIATLIYITETEDDDGYPIMAEEKTEVYVNKKSVTRTEFYTAMQSGFRPTALFEVRESDFEVTRHVVNKKPVYADKLEHEGIIYDIIRTYVKENEIMELTCG